VLVEKAVCVRCTTRRCIKQWLCWSDRLCGGQSWGKLLEPRDASGCGPTPAALPRPPARSWQFLRLSGDGLWPIEPYWSTSGSAVWVTCFGGIDAVTSSSTGLGGYVSNDEITVFCNGDSIIWFTARGWDGSASVQPASKSASRKTALIMVPLCLWFVSANISVTCKQTCNPAHTPDDLAWLAVPIVLRSISSPPNGALRLSNERIMSWLFVALTVLVAGFGAYTLYLIFHWSGYAPLWLRIGPWWVFCGQLGWYRPARKSHGWIRQARQTAFQLVAFVAFFSSNRKHRCPISRLRTAFGLSAPRSTSVGEPFAAQALVILGGIG